MDLAPRQVVIERRQLEQLELELERAHRGARILVVVYIAGILTGLALASVFAWV